MQSTKNSDPRCGPRPGRASTPRPVAQRRLAMTLLLATLSTGPLLVAAVPVGAQVMCSATNVSNPGAMTVRKTVHFSWTGSETAGCRLFSMTAAVCLGGTVTQTLMGANVMTGTLMLTGMGAYTPAPGNEYCGWNCGALGPNTTCATVTMTNAEGLPVELMGFEVEAEEDEAPKEDEQ